MRVVVAPDKFAGTLSAVEAAAAIAAGWRRTAPHDELVEVPLADGGPGFVEVVRSALGGELRTVEVSGPTGDPATGHVLLVDGTAYVEAAEACGLHLVPEPRDPSRTTSYGVGQLLLAARDAGATSVVVGLGGSGTNDAGAGLLAALGATAATADGADATDRLRLGGGALREVAAVDLGPALEAVRGLGLVAASDVDNPLLGLRGATNGFGRQKGADDAMLMRLEGDLTAFAAAVGRRPDGRDPAVALGAGAAGGLGYALLLLGATRVPGIGTVLDTVGLAREVAAADLVVTGEGSFDWQSLRGKVVSGVAEVALEHGRGCVVLAGRVEVGRREYAATGVSGALAVVDDLRDRGRPESDAFDHPAAALADLAERAARTWSR
ncbi:MAG: glycerate kinase [Frankiales bacterium]|nr:glycerate kinase [Frankiales bacterium]